MATNGSTTGLRKRAQIAKANRTMFLWIAASSAIIGAAIVVSFFFGQKLIYNEKVLSEKLNTANTLNHNIAEIPKLRDNIRVLETNQALTSVKAKESDQTLQVILDALPSGANSLALGESFQQRLLTGVNGVSIESLSVEPVVGVETDSTDTTSDGSSDGASNVVNFRFIINGNSDNFKQVLQNLERSIRLIDITSLGVESGESRQQLTVSGRAYYEPAKQLQLTNKVIPR